MAETKRVYEIADEVGMESTDVVTYLQAHGYPEVTTHASALPAEAVDGVIAGLRALRTPAGEPALQAGAGVSAQVEEEATETAPQRVNEVEEPSQGGRAGRRKRKAGTDPGMAAGPSRAARDRTVVASDAGATEAAPNDVQYRLQRKASVGAPWLRVVKGGAITAAQYASLPARVKAHFDRVV